ncbi:MAG: sulfopyruvate decarboxylase subunit beta [Euryarchaeota archaeon]|nr:sulfopyruvate decarboxylase subunit beta [Euryarchaeota archaeon]
MKRFDAIKSIVEELTDELVVCNLGYPCRELFAIKDSPTHFYMLGSMGLASSIGLGLALALPKRKIIVLDGDGSLLMNLGSFATIANQNPSNLVLVVLDNEAHGSTGFQPTATGGLTDLERVAKGAGIANSITVKNKKNLKNSLKKALRDKQMHLIVVKIEKGNANVPHVNLSPIEIKNRFINEIKKSK